MKLIDFLTKLSKGEIENGTVLTVNDKGRYREYRYIEGSSFLDDYNLPLNIYGKNDLNSEVILTVPKPKKYRLKLYKNDNLSYITRSSYESDFNYDLSDKSEIGIGEFITKFTQDEIDNDKFLKFIEMYGIKEEVE